MAKKTLRDVTISGKRVLIRVDFNCPLGADGSVANDRRIRSALPTIQFALGGGASVVLMSHLGRPKGDPETDKKFKLDAVATRLGELLDGKTVRKSDEVIGPESQRLASELKPGEVLVLENLRFHPGEKKGDEAFAKELAGLADIYVNDAFGTCHRTDASMYAVPKQFPEGSRVVGFLVARELEVLEELLGSPKRPMIGVMGGAKVSDKMGFIEAVLKQVDRLLIGGAMTYTFRKAKGESVGSSLVEADKLDLANKLIELAGDKLLLPIDHLVAERPEASAATQVVTDEIPDGWCGVDIGPATIERYGSEIAGASTVLWNGPLGKFEDEPFQKGTRGVAEAMAKCAGVTVVGGGESAEAVEVFGLASEMTHVSTGGGAFLEYVEGKPFAALEVIDEA
ncbi:Phosphoglycerate kinase [Planctomycetes bacterium Pan216]|uniref:Phosphoglycerate kinase n=1 Tax=Kolteria novifilia TaxID=2527975 RepID=A0A518BCX5_9BACT|nr:Phosphoglycerate kinase [Planctomycetes bacterium Pan216]